MAVPPTRSATMQDYVTRICWPLIVMVLIGLVYIAYTENSSGNSIFSNVSDMASTYSSSICSNTSNTNTKSSENTEIQKPSDTAPVAHNVALALIHYATSSITPQQTKQEIMVTANILSKRGPCNFLVYGLGFDSPLWHALNHGGRTVFLEEDPSWLKEMSKLHPYLEAYQMKYTTVVRDAKKLLSYARKHRETCSPAIDLSKSKCKLAIKEFPEHINGVDWDVIMIDAPRGYFPEAPGRMGAIFSSAVMAMGPSGHHHHHDKESSVHITDILLHDVDRPIEKNYGMEFLCHENLVEAVGRLWHFEVSVHPAESQGNLTNAFCTAVAGKEV